MAITRKEIEQRIEAYRRDVETAKQQIILLDGAIQDAEFWLARSGDDEPVAPVGSE